MGGWMGFLFVEGRENGDWRLGMGDGEMGDVCILGVVFDTTCSMNK